MKSQSENTDSAAVVFGKTEKGRSFADPKKVNYVLRDESRLLHKNQFPLVKAELERIADRTSAPSHHHQITQSRSDITD